MPTRFYLPSSGSAPVTATVGAEWEHNNGVSRATFPWKTGTSIASTTYSPDAADDITDKDSMFVQFVSPPLLAQTIAAQTVKWAIQVSETNNGNNLFLTVKIYLVANGGGAGTATILAIRRDGTEAATTVTNRTDSATSTSQTCNDGDRLVFEIGLGGLCTATGGVQGHNGTVQFGDDQSTDLAENDTTTGTSNNPWLEFANPVVFVHDMPWLSRFETYRFLFKPNEVVSY